MRWGVEDVRTWKSIILHRGRTDIITAYLKNADAVGSSGHKSWPLQQSKLQTQIQPFCGPSWYGQILPRTEIILRDGCEDAAMLFDMAWSY